MEISKKDLLIAYNVMFYLMEKSKTSYVQNITVVKNELANLIAQYELNNFNKEPEKLEKKIEIITD